MKVTGLKMVGGAYHNGRYCPGWNEVTLDNGQIIMLSDSGGGMNSALDQMDKMGHDTKSYRERLDIWVKTGKMPT